MREYEDIWNVIKNKLNIKFHSQIIYENKYLKTKVRQFDSSIKTNFLDNGLPGENTYYTCFACITIDSVIKMNKKYYPQVYLEECKYKAKKNKYTKICKHWIRNWFSARYTDRFRIKQNNRKLKIKFKYWL